MVHIEVHSISGEVLQLSVEEGCSGESLKALIASRWHVPVTLQKLSLGSTVLDEDDTLKPYCKEKSGKLFITMVLTLDKVLERLSSWRDADKKEALVVLSKLGPKGGEPSVDAIISCLASQSTTAAVRLQAQQTLKGVAAKNNLHAVDSLVALLENDASLSRRAAIDALPVIVERGDAHAVVAVSGLLEHEEACVRQSALQVLTRIAGAGDVKLTRILIVTLVDIDAKVRDAAVSALANICSPGNECAVDTIVRLLKHEDAPVRLSALQALVAVGGKNKSVLLGLVSCFGDRDLNVRNVAVSKFSDIGQRDAAQAIDILSQCLEHSAQPVRLSAVHAMGRVAQKGNKIAIRELTRCSRDADRGIRECVLEVLQLLGEKGDTQITNVLSVCLEDEDAAVRRAARMALDRLQ